MQTDIVIRSHCREDGTRRFSLHFIPDEPPLCELPTLRQAVMLCRYMNGGIMGMDEREAVLVSLDVEASAFRKAQRSRRKSDKLAREETPDSR